MDTFQPRCPLPGQLIVIEYRPTLWSSDSLQIFWSPPRPRLCSTLRLQTSHMYHESNALARDQSQGTRPHADNPESWGAFSGIVCVVAKVVFFCTIALPFFVNFSVVYLSIVL